MSDDYIKREDATEEACKGCNEQFGEEPCESSECCIRERLSATPSADVVEADKAQKEIDYWHDKAQSYEKTILKLSLNKADVVEVVRCKDCKYYTLKPQQTSRVTSVRRCNRSAIVCTKPDDFCSFGERIAK